MGGATLYCCGGWSQTFEPRWLGVTGTEERRGNRKWLSSNGVFSVSAKMFDFDIDVYLYL